MDVSPFLLRYRLPKLRCLRLLGCTISSWDLLGSQIITLTTLELTAFDSPSFPTPPDLLQVSILSSNPLLQYLSLSYSPIAPVFSGNMHSPVVSLRHLEEFHLAHKFRYAFWLLGRLELPDRLNDLKPTLYDCPPSGISKTLGPHLGDRLRRRGRFPGGGLGLLAYSATQTL